MASTPSRPSGVTPTDGSMARSPALHWQPVGAPDGAAKFFVAAQQASLGSSAGLSLRKASISSLEMGVVAFSGKVLRGGRQGGGRDRVRGAAWRLCAGGQGRCCRESDSKKDQEPSQGATGTHWEMNFCSGEQEPRSATPLERQLGLCAPARGCTHAGSAADHPPGALLRGRLLKEKPGALAGWPSVPAAHQPERRLPAGR